MLFFGETSRSGAKAEEWRAVWVVVPSSEVPLSPPLAHTANMEGVVHVRITTDGQRVKIAHAEDGPKLLAAAAEENARTWQFAVHEPTTFTVIYKYALATKWDNDPNKRVVVRRCPNEDQA